ncbi:MAG TPA: hypothetical protein VGH33_09040 [Isosphaeraceae bacterium]
MTPGVAVNTPSFEVSLDDSPPPQLFETTWAWTVPAAYESPASRLAMLLLAVSTRTI